MVDCFKDIKDINDIQSKVDQTGISDDWENQQSYWLNKWKKLSINRQSINNGVGRNNN